MRQVSPTQIFHPPSLTPHDHTFCFSFTALASLLSAILDPNSILPINVIIKHANMYDGTNAYENPQAAGNLAPIAEAVKKVYILGHYSTGLSRGGEEVNHANLV